MAWLAGAVPDQGPFWRASAIIVAAGWGRRLGLGVPKAFVELCGRPLFYYPLRVVETIPEIFEAILTVPAGLEAAAEELLAGMEVNLPVKVVAGGERRQDSVEAGLRLVSAESELIVVHDAARPNAPSEFFRSCLAAAAQWGAALCAIPVADTLKRVEHDVVLGTVPRQGLYQAQTPQAFRASLLKAAHDKAKAHGWEVTDDAELVERLGAQVRVVEGSAHNLKITTKHDLVIAEILLRELKSKS